MRYLYSLVFLCILAPAPPSQAGPFFYCYAEDDDTIYYQASVPGRVHATIRGPLDGGTFDFPDLTQGALAQRDDLACSAPQGNVVAGEGYIRLRLHAQPSGFANCEIRFTCGANGLKLSREN